MFKKTLLIGLMLSFIVGAGVVQAAEKIHLTIWSDWSGNIPIFQELMNIYMERNPHVEITWEWSFGDHDKLVMSVISGTGPDIVCYGLVPELIEDGMFEPLDKYLANSVLMEDIPPNLWPKTQWKGQTYGVPAIEGGPGWGLFYNKDRFGRAALPTPGPDEVLSIDDFLALHAKLSNVGPDGVVTELGFYPPETNGHHYTRWEAFYNVKAVDLVNGKAQLDHPRMLAAAETLMRIYEIGGGRQAMLEFVGSSSLWPSMQSLFVTGKTAMMHAGYWAVSSLESGGMSVDDYGVTWSPNIDGLKVQNYSGWQLLILSNCAHKEEAFKVVEFIASGEGQAYIFEKLSWLGGMPRSLFDYVDVYANPQIAWFLNSMFTADNTSGVADLPNPYYNLTAQLWQDAFLKITSGEQSPVQALQEANRLLQLEIDATWEK